MTIAAIRNARIVTPDAVLEGGLSVEDARIAQVDPGAGSVGEDWEGDYCLPGLVELHTDHIENHYKPRPGVVWEPALAAQAHDAQIAGAGITTVFDALCVGMDGDRMGPDELRALVRGVQDQQSKGLLRAEHFTHLRCEVSSPLVEEAYAAFDDEPSVRLVSLMDHTPGQRQFQSLDQHRFYYQGRHGLSDADYLAFVERLTEQAAQHSDANRRAIAGHAQARGVTLASHDDATPDHVAEAVRDGVAVAEFPTTVEAARLSAEAGMAVLMGAPNIVRGGSHSGNVAAAELASRDLLTVLSSDYVPYALLQSAFLLADLEGYDLPRAVRAVSKTPAEALGLDDRGAILAGRRADLVRVHMDGSRPIVRAVYRAGRRVS
ncbi:MAG: alpha-D-ribose 1-methylphosphonate 5-triphosphate diphosphatase [Pseudomonadota bacterium]